jgi:hypothetical protein
MIGNLKLCLHVPGTPLDDSNKARDQETAERKKAFLAYFRASPIEKAAAEGSQPIFRHHRHLVPQNSRQMIRRYWLSRISSSQLKIFKSMETASGV